MSSEPIKTAFFIVRWYYSTYRHLYAIILRMMPTLPYIFMNRARPVFTDTFSGIIFDMGCFSYELLIGVFTTRHYTNPRLPLPLPYFTNISECLWQNKRNCLKLHFVPSQTITSHLIG